MKLQNLWKKRKNSIPSGSAHNPIVNGYYMYTGTPYTLGKNVTITNKTICEIKNNGVREWDGKLCLSVKIYKYGESATLLYSDITTFKKLFHRVRFNIVSCTLSCD